MSQQRREFLRLMGAAGLLGGMNGGYAAGATGTPQPEPAPAHVHDMSGFPKRWYGHEQIAMMLYPGFTALDLVGPQYMLAGLLGATVHLVARTDAPVMCDTGLAIVPTATFASCPQILDILFVPGGSVGTAKAMDDPVFVDFLAQRAARAKLIVSVCTGSMLLGQAGLLRGKRATSHWIARDLLPQFGAIPVNQRVVWDGNVVTGAGVSAGLDVGLSIVAKLRDDEYAQVIQLMAEYAPQPPFNAGSPETAPPHVHTLISDMSTGLRQEYQAAGQHARGAVQSAKE